MSEVPASVEDNDTPNFAAEYTRTYNSSSGVFMAAAGRALNGIMITVSREMAPIYTMGNPKPNEFKKGKRGVAGNMVPVCDHNDWPNTFDIELLGYNDYGHLMHMILKNCEVLSQHDSPGDPASVTFVAERILPWCAAKVIRVNKSLEPEASGGHGLLSE